MVKKRITRSGTTVLDPVHIPDQVICPDRYQGFQLSRIERESPVWTLFLPLSRQACKISRIDEKNPAKHVQSPASVGKPFKNNYLAIIHWQGGMLPQKIIRIIIYLST